MASFPSVATYLQREELAEQYLKYILANDKWYPKGQQCHLFLMHPQNIADVAAESAVNEVGFRDTVSTYENQYMRCSYDPRDFSETGKMLIQKSAQNNFWITEYRKSFEAATKTFWKIAREIYFHFKPKSLSEVKKSYINLVDSALKPQGYGYITESFTITDNYWVRNHINELAPGITDEDFNTLCQPVESSFTKIYEQELLRAKTKKDFQEILRDYYWVKGSYFTQPPMTLEMLQKEKEKIREDVIDYTALKRKKKRITSGYAKKAPLSRFVTLIEHFIAIQDERKANVLRLNYALRRIVQATQQFHPNWTEEEILSLTGPEFLELCDGKLKESHKKVIEKRNKKSVWLYVREGYVISTQPEFVQTIFQLLQDKNTNILTGYSASRGKVTGKTKIILSENDFAKMEEGDILITSMTRPEFMPVLRMAAAFVTNEGGITSHAATIARELGKPCIMSTRIATQVLKDEDEVTVDADQGIVTIIKKS